MAGQPSFANTVGTTFGQGGSWWTGMSKMGGAHSAVSKSVQPFLPKYEPNGGGAIANPAITAPPPKQSDPLALDLDGDGIAFTAFADRETFFDIDADGFAEKVSWLHPSDGFLALDANGNGRIDDIDELFGSASENGFADLARQDSNGDGRIDRADPIYGRLLVWRDRDGDAQTDQGELSSLAAAKVGSIDLAAVPSLFFREGNLVTHLSGYERPDGTTRDVWAVQLQNSQTLTRWLAPEGFSYGEGVIFAPFLNGYGVLPNLWAAMTLDEGLHGAVVELVLDLPGLRRAALEGRFADVLFDWAGVSDLDPGSRGPADFDARKLAFLEAYYGETLSTVTITDRTAAVWEDEFAELSAQLLIRFVSQAPGFHILQATSQDEVDAVVEDLGNLFYAQFAFSWQTDRIAFQLEGVTDVLRLMAGSLSPQEVERLGEFAKLVVDLKPNLFAGDEAAYAAALDAVPDIGLGAGPLLRDLLLGHEVVAGSPKADDLDAGFGNQLVAAGKGDDTLDAGRGSDSYVYRAGDGADVVHDGGVFFNDDVDRLLLGEGLTVGKLVVTQSTAGDDLVLRFRGEAGRITLDDVLLGEPSRIEQAVFAGGTTLTYEDLFDLSNRATDRADALSGDERGNALSGLGGRDALVGRDGDDTLEGGTGADSLDGGRGSDDYRFDKGDGRDVVHDGGVFFNDDLDRVLFGRGLDPDRLIVTQSAAGDDLILRFRGGDDRLVLDDVLLGEPARIERVLFADGTRLTYAQLFERSISGTDGGDRLFGDDRGNRIGGGRGGDTIVAGLGDDTLDGGRGDDSLDGGRGSDDYLVRAGGGHDVIRDGGVFFNADVDRVVFGDGFDPTRLIVTKSAAGDDLILSFAGRKERVTLDDTLLGEPARIEQAVFANGVTLDHDALIALL